MPSPWSTLLGAAALTSASLLTLLWPHSTFAEDDSADPTARLEGDGTKLDENVVVEGEIQRDPKSKTGWVVEMRAINRSGEGETVGVETDLTRAIANTMDRAEPTPTTVWKHVDTLTVAAGETETRLYTVPATFGAQLSAGHRAEARVAAQREKGVYSNQRVAFFGVAFQKVGS